MRVLDLPSAAMTAEYGITIGRWASYGLPSHLPFDAMWCVIEPGSSSQRDCHPEAELAIVMDGRALFRSEEKETLVEAGAALLLDPEQPHVITNTHEDKPLVILSVYWIPQATAEAASA